jgi:hypothetical protein
VGRTSKPVNVLLTQRLHFHPHFELQLKYHHKASRPQQQLPKFRLKMCFCRRYGNSTIQTLLTSKESALQQGGSSQRITIVPPLSAAWFSDIVIPAVIVSVVVVVSLFAIVVLLLLRRHIQLESRDITSYHREHDDRNALTPGSVRRGCSPPSRPSQLQQQPLQTASIMQRPHHQNNHNGGIVMHVDLDHVQHGQQREELFLC